MTQPTDSPPADPACDDDSPLCPACGYDLRASEGDRCSECGTPIDRDSLRTSAFPWAHRRAIGRLRAFIRTVWMVTTNSRALRGELAKPQDLPAARSFSRILAAVVALVFLGGFAAGVVAEKGIAFMAVQPVFSGRADGRGWLLDLLIPWSAGATMWPVMPLVLLAMALLVSRSHVALFRNRAASAARQERLATVGHYAAAPLAWLLPAAAVEAASILWACMSERDDPLVLAPWAITAGAVILPLVRVAQWVIRARHGGAGTGLLAAGQMLGLWLLGGCVLFGLVPWCIGYVWIVIDSFR